MKPGIIPLIFFLFTTKVKTAERLSQTTVKFEPFEGPNFLPLHHVSIAKVENTISATTPTSVYAKTEKVVDKRHVHEQYPGYANFRDLLDQRIRGNSVPQVCYTSSKIVINPSSGYRDLVFRNVIEKSGKRTSRRSDIANTLVRGLL